MKFAEREGSDSRKAIENGNGGHGMPCPYGRNRARGEGNGGPQGLKPLRIERRLGTASRQGRDAKCAKAACTDIKDCSAVALEVKRQTTPEARVI